MVGVWARSHDGTTLGEMWVSATERAIAIVERVKQVRSGSLTITIGTGCCESTAPFLYEDFWPGPDQEIIGEVAGVSVFAPEYLRTNYDDEGLVIDVLENQPAESMSIETEFDCRLILRGLGVDLGREDLCVLPDVVSPTLATGAASAVVGELPEALRRMRIR
jgi:uncharacterized protein (DUF779 family)